jgi:hypothetical protein
VANIPGLYFVIARNDQARFVRPDPDNGLHTVRVVDLEALRRNDCNANGGCGPPGLAFLRRLAGRIDEDRAVDLFTHVVLVGAPDILQELMGLIDAPTTACLFGCLARDLMTVPDLELWPWLLPWIQPIRMNHAPRVGSREW